MAAGREKKKKTKKKKKKKEKKFFLFIYFFLFLDANSALFGLNFAQNRTLAYGVAIFVMEGSEFCCENYLAQFLLKNY
jgi:hypothetical protein